VFMVACASRVWNSSRCVLPEVVDKLLLGCEDGGLSGRNSWAQPSSLLPIRRIGRTVHALNGSRPLSSSRSTGPATRRVIDASQGTWPLPVIIPNHPLRDGTGWLGAPSRVDSRKERGKSGAMCARRFRSPGTVRTAVAGSQRTTPDGPGLLFFACALRPLSLPHSVKIAKRARPVFHSSGTTVDDHVHPGCSILDLGFAPRVVEPTIPHPVTSRAFRPSPGNSRFSGGAPPNQMRSLSLTSAVEIVLPPTRYQGRRLNPAPFRNFSPSATRTDRFHSWGPQMRTAKPAPLRAIGSMSVAERGRACAINQLPERGAPRGVFE
jgi:hypothetical protein